MDLGETGHAVPGHPTWPAAPSRAEGIPHPMPATGPDGGAPGAPGAGAAEVAVVAAAAAGASASTGAEDIQLDLEACELDALQVFLDSNGADLQRMADGSPRRVPPKARRSRERLARALLESWAWPECRAYLTQQMTATAICRSLQQRGFAMLPEVSGCFPANALLWYVDAAGLDAQGALDALGQDSRDQCLRRQPLLQRLVQQLRGRREERVAQAGDAKARAARAEAERLTRQIRWRADQAEDKYRRAAAQVERVARGKDAEINRLKDELATARRRQGELEAENAELRAAFDAAARAQHEVAATLTRQVRALAASARGAGVAVPALAGEYVLVVGDDSHKVDYRRTVEELGGGFTFHPGFAVGPRLSAALASATLVCFIAAYASHQAQDHVRAAERAGLAVVTVPVAGAEAFRRAILAWCAGRALSGLAARRATALPAR